MGDGGEGGGDGDVGGEGVGAPMLKLTVSVERPSSSDAVCSQPVHTLPFHPSPYESAMSSVQVPGGTACVSE